MEDLKLGSEQLKSIMWQRTHGREVFLLFTIFWLSDKRLIFSGNFLPHPITYGTLVPTNEGSFLIVGGNNGIDQLDTIYKYQVDEDNWKLLEKKLPRKAEKLTAMMIGWELRHLFPTCNGGQG